MTHDEFCRHPVAGCSACSSHANYTPEERTQYANEKEHATDRYPRRLGGSLPGRRRWWVPGLQRLLDTR
eukprot:7629904-Pyramimonas_sp.AAC.1